MRLTPRGIFGSPSYPMNHLTPSSPIYFMQRLPHHSWLVNRKVVISLSVLEFAVGHLKDVLKACSLW